MHKGKHTVALVFATVGTALAAAPVRAGQPLVCSVFAIGDAASLPWTAGKDGALTAAAYGSERLVADTLALLVPKTPVLVRMETLRRASIYARNFAQQQQSEVGRLLAFQLVARALDAEARGTPDALAWFDAGYFAESLEQAGKGLITPVDGYAWVGKALRLRGDDAQMEFAAMLIAYETPARPGRHWRRVQAGSKHDPALARQLAAQYAGL
jgi:hypothetical protein